MNRFTNQFMENPKNVEFLKETMMGPNAMRVTEELASHLTITENMRVLDLGCGKGLSSLLLAKKYGVSVVAADLWISPTENNERFQSLGIDEQVMPISVDATQGLPFANGYFDLLISIDGYHYFGDQEGKLSFFASFVKKGGYVALAIPGITYEFGDKVPEEMKPFWNEDIERTIHSLEWWKELWSKDKGVEIMDIREMVCCKQGWDEWLTAYHPIVATDDIPMREAGADKYFNLIQMIAKVV
jgi:cyclopropane fatty-acyl-phospholipid synthase-like methyltransferase